jgi:ADP-ribose pyrophosphatase YjhB (NUDIX family)
MEPELPAPDGPVDPTVSPTPTEDGPRPGLFTLMAPGWVPPVGSVTQALGLCFTASGLVVLVTSDGSRWTLPGGTVEADETIEATLMREIAEEACARVVRSEYLACQHVADPLNPDGPPSYYQTRWWARVELHAWQPRHEMVGRRILAPDGVLPALYWRRKEIAARLLAMARDADRRDRMAPPPAGQVSSG